MQDAKDLVGFIQWFLMLQDLFEYTDEKAHMTEEK